jgi:acetolactate decarboxylase
MRPGGRTQEAIEQEGQSIMNRQIITAIALITMGVILTTGVLISGCTTPRVEGKSLFITGSYGALNRGVYDGAATVADLKRHGDFALGTFSGIDGELLGLDGKYYQIGAAGKVNPANDAMTTPNTTTTFFKADKVVVIDKPMSYQELQQYLNGQLPTQNIYYAIKVSGTFDSIKARSLTKLNQPYPSTPYSTITQNEPTFDFNNVDGAMVIIVSPTYMNEISYPGYHTHFISSDGKNGGHVLDGRIAKGQAEVDILPNFTVNLPQNSMFYQADFAKPR